MAVVLDNMHTALCTLARDGVESTCHLSKSFKKLIASRRVRGDLMTAIGLPSVMLLLEFSITVS